MMMSSAEAPSDLQVDKLEVSEQDKIAAENYKSQANDLFAKKHYHESIQLYTDAISCNPYVPAYYSNRAYAYIKIELYGAAISDAEKCISLDSSFVKGYYRRAVGNMALGNLKAAVADFKSVCKVAPRDADARTKLQECITEYKRREFEKAIASEEEKSAIDSIQDLDNMAVDSSYSGPHLASTGITLEFVKEMLEHFKNQKVLATKYTYQIIRAARDILVNLPSIVDITIPSNGKITVCGDIHGQYYDLMNIFGTNGLPSPTNYYLFNGDFVDRGSFSVECILTLLAFKVLYPAAMHLSRGNHETNDMNKVYGFEGEVKAKYTDVCFKMFSEVFNCVPLGQVIGEKILVVHGGLFSRDDVTLDELRAINRYKQPGNTGLMCELLWSDPQPQPGRSPSKRGVGLQFGPDVTEAFLKRNQLDLLIRSHEVQENGYSEDHNGKCITIFSAPNYCDTMGNQGAFIHIMPDLSYTFHKFSASEHPANVRAMRYAPRLYGGMM